MHPSSESPYLGKAIRNGLALLAQPASTHSCRCTSQRSTISLEHSDRLGPRFHRAEAFRFSPVIAIASPYFASSNIGPNLRIPLSPSTGSLPPRGTTVTVPNNKCRPLDTSVNQWSWLPSNFLAARRASLHVLHSEP